MLSTGTNDVKNLILSHFVTNMYSKMTLMFHDWTILNKHACGVLPYRRFYMMLISHRLSAVRAALVTHDIYPGMQKIKHITHLEVI